MAIARAHDAAYDKATLAYDVKTMLIFYEDKAEAIYPGEGEVATDKAGIEKLIRNFISPWCSQGHEKPTLKEISFHAVPLGPDYIMIVRIVDATDTQGTVRGRATELIHRSSGKWRYLVDHASLERVAELKKGSSSPFASCWVLVSNPCLLSVALDNFGCHRPVFLYDVSHQIDQIHTDHRTLPGCSQAFVAALSAPSEFVFAAL